MSLCEDNVLEEVDSDSEQSVGSSSEDEEVDSEEEVYDVDWDN